MTAPSPPRNRTDEDRRRIGADDARGGEIILRSRRHRFLFIAGLAIPIVIAAAAGLF